MVQRSFTVFLAICATMCISQALHSEKKEHLDSTGEVLFRISTMCFTLGGFMCPSGVYGLMLGGLYFANAPEEGFHDFVKHSGNVIALLFTSINTALFSIMSGLLFRCVALHPFWHVSRISLG